MQAQRATLYDEDFCEWTRHRADLLRAGRFEEAGVEHIAGEIETGLPPSEFPSKCPFTVEQILDPDFLP